jgi:ribosomal protein S18 acetylase RimI-like enzyme
MLHAMAKIRPDDPSGDLIVETEPRPEDIRFLEEQLYTFNVAATGIKDGKLFAVFVRSVDGSPIAGASGWTWGGTCYIRHLLVSEARRGQRLGSALLRAVEKEAVSRKCHQIVLETHDFQAPAFYHSVGFVVVGRVGDYPRGHQYLTLVKRLL